MPKSQSVSMGTGSQSDESYMDSLPHLLHMYSIFSSMGVQRGRASSTDLPQNSQVKGSVSFLGWQRCPLPLAALPQVGQVNVFTYRSVILVGLLSLLCLY